VLAIVGQQARSALGSFYQQEVDLVALFKDVASDYVLQLSDAEQVRHAVDCAMRIAMAKKDGDLPDFFRMICRRKRRLNRRRACMGRRFPVLAISNPEIVPEKSAICVGGGHSE